MNWVGHTIVLAVMMMIYGAGFAGGRGQCDQHSVIHSNLKP